jgi:ERO1-like protein alpha
MYKFIAILLLSWLIAFTTCEESCSAYDEAMIPDCNCKTQSVEQAVVQVLTPLLKNITESTFFRYFFVDLEKPCPFWHEEGMCMMEACSVCTCEESEIPKRWLEENNLANLASFGWIAESKDVDEAQLGRVTVSASATASDDTSSSASDREASKELNRRQRSSQGYLSHLHATEDCDTLHNDWTTVEEAAEGRSLAEVGVYVNLLQNPERYTGYSGVPAQRVWTAIAEENCFLPAGSLSASSTASSSTLQKEVLEEQCLETRVFYRLIAGLRASITVHIAREYRHPIDQYNYRWGPHEELFLQHIAPYPDRLQNMYFTFLFLLRAVAKGEAQLMRHTLYDTGDAAADNQLRQQLQALYSFLRHSPLGDSDSNENATRSNSHEVDFLYGKPSNSDSSSSVLAECASAFNETRLFQPQLQESPLTSIAGISSSHGAGYAGYLDYAGSNAQALLREEFRMKFRNISRILDCVSCEKCRLWGKLQILGLGTAAKILLHEGAEDAVYQDAPSSSSQLSLRLRRQEVIALVNTLHQLTKSVAFAAQVLPKYNQRQQKLFQQKKSQIGGVQDPERQGDNDAIRFAQQVKEQLLCSLDPRESVKGVILTACVCLSTLTGYYMLVWRRKTHRDDML